MQPGKQIKIISTIFGRRVQAVLRGKNPDISGIMSWIIAFISENQQNAVYQKDIEKEFGLSRSAVSRVLGQMEEKGLVTRSTSGEDSRLKELKLTEKAKVVSKQLYSICQSVEDELVKGFSQQEKAQLCGYLARIEENLRHPLYLNKTFSEKE